MKIEDCWEDIILYNIIFKSELGKVVEKLIVLPAYVEDVASVESIIIKKFNKVKEVIRIDRLEDGLAIKK